MTNEIAFISGVYEIPKSVLKNEALAEFFSHSLLCFRCRYKQLSDLLYYVSSRHILKEKLKA